MGKLKLLRFARGKHKKVCQEYTDSPRSIGDESTSQDEKGFGTRREASKSINMDLYM